MNDKIDNAPERAPRRRRPRAATREDEVMIREVSFGARDGWLEMDVTPRRGRHHTHRRVLVRCERVARDIEGRAVGVPIEDLRACLDLPQMEVAAGLAFVKQPSHVEVRCRRSHPASPVLLEDARLEDLARGRGVGGAR